jgi:hypothetical protein
MANLSQVQPGNWLTYIPENQYCTFVSQDEDVLVEMYNGQRRCSSDDLTFIRVSADVFSVCKFTMRGADWIRKVGTINLIISYNSDIPYLSAANTAPIQVAHVHALQNAYKVLTGESLIPNIYGIHSPD